MIGGGKMGQALIGGLLAAGWAEPEDLAVVGRELAGEHLEQGGLAGAVGPHQAYALPGGDREIGAPQDEPISKCDLDVLTAEDHGPPNGVLERSGQGIA